MIIRTADVKLQIPDVRQALLQVEPIPTLVGGMVVASSFNQSQEQNLAAVTLRVLPDQKTFQEVMDRLAAMEGARVTERNVRSEDVIDEFADLEAQLRNLRATEARLLALVEPATRLEEILFRERELSTPQSRIERLEGRKRLLERRTELATIVITLMEVALGKETRPGWDPIETAERAFAALVNATQRSVIILIWLAVWLPPYGPPLFLLWLVGRRMRQPRPAA